MKPPEVVMWGRTHEGNTTAILDQFLGQNIPGVVESQLCEFVEFSPPITPYSWPGMGFSESFLMVMQMPSMESVAGWLMLHGHKVLRMHRQPA